MASKEKVRRFREESESHNHYSSIVECTLTYFIAKAKTDGNARLAADLEQAKAEYHKEFEQALQLTEDVHAELFTDEELDDLIVLHSNPALKKARALTSDIFNEVLERYLSRSA
jgi:hypothetical protein